MNVADLIKAAFRALRANALRSVLTMLGIFIGVAAVITTSAVGAGARARVVAQIQSLGSNLILIWPGNLTSGGVRLGAGSNPVLTTDDAIALAREIPSVQIATPTVRGSVQIVAGSTNWSTTVHGIEPSYLAAREWKVASGRVFGEDEAERSAQVALLGASVARILFEQEDPVGRSIRIRNVPFVIAGVLAPKGQSTNGQDQDDVVLVPLEAARQRILGVNRANARAIGSILVKIYPGDDVDHADEDIREVLRQRHRLQPNQDDDFFTRSLSDVSAVQDASSRTLSWLLASIAGVSLLVGGIGVMNIMLVSVTERTREIGVRLAIGAQPLDIQRQFLFEAVTLSAVGGLAGIVLGVAAAIIIGPMAGWPTLIQANSIAMALGLSGLVGAVFGFYPAHRASRLTPIEALRHE